MRFFLGERVVEFVLEEIQNYFGSYDWVFISFSLNRFSLALLCLYISHLNDALFNFTYMLEQLSPLYLPLSDSALDQLS